MSDHGRNVLLGRGVFLGVSTSCRPASTAFLRVLTHVQGDGPVRALCVAQWIERKGILTLVEAWALRERKGAVLELIGETDGPRLRRPSGTPSKQRHGTPSS